jgi:hypothetical protein
MTWLYRSDAIQCLTRNRVSASRHSYGKTAATVRTMCDPIRTMSSIRQELAYQVQPSERQPSWSGRSSFIYGNCVHQFNRPDVKLQGPNAPSLIMVISCSRSATVRMLGQAFRTPLGILVINFYSNIGLGRNRLHWKA